MYALIDPRTRMIRYVGKSSSGWSRIDQHKNVRATDKTYRANWLRQLKTNNLAFEVTLLEYCEDKHKLQAAEIWWIAYGRACDWPLTNVTDGQDGTHGWKWSAEHRAKMSGDNSPTKRPEVRAKISASRKLMSAEERSEISKRATERMNRPDVKARFMGDNNFAKSPEVRAKISANNPMKLKKYQEMMSAAMRAKHSDPVFHAAQVDRFQACTTTPEALAAKSAWAVEHMNQPEVRERIRNQVTEQWKDPEFRERRLAAMRAGREAKRRANSK